MHAMQLCAEDRDGAARAAGEKGPGLFRPYVHFRDMYSVAIYKKIIIAFSCLTMYAAALIIQL